MRFDILTIIRDGKKYYSLTVYKLAYQPAEKICSTEFTNKTDLWRFVKRQFSLK